MSRNDIPERSPLRLFEGSVVRWFHGLSSYCIGMGSARSSSRDCLSLRVAPDLSGSMENNQGVVLMNAAGGRLVHEQPTTVDKSCSLVRH